MKVDKDQISAWGVHAFTGSGAILGFLALISILNNEISETLKEIAEKNGLSKSSQKILLSILEDIATTDDNHVTLLEKTNHLLSNMKNKEDKN